MDWNNDGKLDILSGCYWTSEAQAGHIHLMLGKEDGTFEEATPLKNEDDKPLENISISKEEYESDDGISNITEAICTQQHAADLDGDGDLDIINGCFASSFYYYENKGTAEAPSISAEPVLLPIKSTSYHAAPHLVDWDNDGDLDLLSGTGGGGVFISFNEGDSKKAEWSEFKAMIDMSDKHEQVLFDGVEIGPSPSTRVWAYDWNDDGLLDLLVGDSATVVEPKEGLTEEEFKQKEKEFNEEMAKASQAYSEVAQRYSAAREELKEDEEMDEELSEEFQEAQQAYMDFRNKREEWCKSTMTGHVWLYIRKAPTESESPTSDVSLDSR